MSYEWDVGRYIAEAEHSTDSGLQDYQNRELGFVLATPDLAERTVIDVGAGYGRVLPKIAPQAKRYIAVEQDKNELEELRKRAEAQTDTTVIEGSGDEIEDLISDDVESPLLLSMQNTLGPWVGNREVAITQLAEVAKRGDGDVIVSIFCAEALKTWGLRMYATMPGLLGNFDPEASELDKGVFRSDSGYESRWFFQNEREAIKAQLGGNVVRKLTDPKFEIFQISY